MEDDSCAARSSFQEQFILPVQIGSNLSRPSKKIILRAALDSGGSVIDFVKYGLEMQLLKLKFGDGRSDVAG